MKEIQILKPDIFPKDKIIAGVTLANKDLFPPHGFSIFPGEIYSQDIVEEHRQILADNIGVDRKRLKFQKQVHASSIAIMGKGSSFKEPFRDSDGMICNQKGVVINITIADCCAILIYDPKEEVIAAFHSGWKGTKEKIVKKGIKLLIEDFESDAEDLIVYISPCASGKNYEVRGDVAQYFPDSVKQIGEDKYLLDIKNEVINQLISEGVKKDNIEASEICTIENENYHSFRRDRNLSGRMAAYIAMKEEINY